MTISINAAGSLADLRNSFGGRSLFGTRWVGLIPLGANVEIGVAVNENNGYGVYFIRGGGSVGLGGSAGVEFAVQRGTLFGVVGDDATEFEIDANLVGGNAVLDLSGEDAYEFLVGAGINSGIGVFRGLNSTNFQAITQPFVVSEDPGGIPRRIP